MNGVRVPVALSFLVVLVLVIGCGGGKKQINANASVSPTFASISREILKPGCVECHGIAAGYNFETYNSALGGVVKGDPAKSPIITSIKSGRMPKEGVAPSAEQVKAIEEWIAAGAPDN